MAYIQDLFLIKENTAIAKDIFSMVIKCPQVAAEAQPGQFVHILPAGATLRRPISICGIDSDEGTLRIVYAVKGEGTKKISQMREGENIDMLAPLGHGFTVNDSFKKVVLVGGGIGLPPMLPLAKAYREKAVCISGFRSFDAVILQEDLKTLGAETILCTDDGSVGRKGLVTEPLKELLEKGGIDAVYACGPMPMLKGVASICNEKDVFCEISLEERMGCGVGACLVCACKTKKDGQEHFSHVCKNGPVFDAKEVVF